MTRTTLVSSLAAALLLSGAALAEDLRVLAYQTEPFFFVDDSGTPKGLEYEILDYFAKSSGATLDVTWVEVFEELLPMLQRGEGDIVAATVTITPERQAVVDFSAPYFPVRVMLVEPDGQSSPDLESLAGATLATMRGTTYEKLLQAVPDAEFVYGESEKELFDIVADGRARALAVDSAVAFGLMPHYQGLSFGIPLSEEQGYGFAVEEGSPLAESLTKHLAKLKSSGIYYRLLEKYLGEEAVRVVLSGKQP